jgi:hypothetical protein
VVARVQRAMTVLLPDSEGSTVNFFAHAKLALWRSDDPRFVLGAMLPDLSGMLGLRLRNVDHPTLAAGVSYHYATDAAFHAAPIFLTLCADGVATLNEAGVSRGTARAVAHVGTELLLDGALSRDVPALQAYRAALENGARERLVDHLDVASSANAQSLHEGLTRLLGAPVPEGYREPAFVFARLRSILARRPRLAVQDSDLARVQRYVEDSQPRVTRLWPELLEQVRLGLAH